jgi:AraC family transcriptional regulator of adaptative response/methylated-DNA-[protein]-cysteine methyltransferase
MSGLPMSSLAMMSRDSKSDSKRETNRKDRRASFPTDDARWQAVRRRDLAAEGAFYYAVQSTGVYCRPTCGARLPRRENVSFHATCADAERAGFRPCALPAKRATLADRHAAVRDGGLWIEEALAQGDDMPSLAALARSAGLSRFHFHRVFKALAGVTPKAYADAYRARRVRAALTQDATVTEAIYGAGFNSNGRFYAAAPGLLGMTPTQLRAGGDGTVVRFAVGQCSLGRSWSRRQKGVCAIDSATIRSVWCADSGRFATPGSSAAIGNSSSGSPGIGSSRRRRAVSICRSTSAGPRSGSGCGCHPRHPGEATALHRDAKRIGAPDGAMPWPAPAHRMRRNRHPCHRVVRSDGSISGYRWAWRKRTGARAGAVRMTGVAAARRERFGARAGALAARIAARLGRDCGA